MKHFFPPSSFFTILPVFCIQLNIFFSLSLRQLFPSSISIHFHHFHHHSHHHHLLILYRKYVILNILFRCLFLFTLKVYFYFLLLHIPCQLIMILVIFICFNFILIIMLTFSFSLFPELFSKAFIFVFQNITLENGAITIT